MAVGQVSFKDQKKVRHGIRTQARRAHLMPKVRKIHVEQRENPIVNRLNKTKVERYPDLKREKEDSLRDARKKDQAAQREKVIVDCSNLLLHVLTVSSKRKKPGLPRRGERKPGREIMLMTTCTLRTQLRGRVINKIVTSMTLCREFGLRSGRGNDGRVRRWGARYLANAHSHALIQHPHCMVELVAGRLPDCDFLV